MAPCRNWIIQWELVCLLVSPLPWSLSSRLSNEDDVTTQLFYDIYEQLPVQTSVADIFTDSRLSELQLNNGQTRNSLQFEILFATFQDLFSIESPSGILRISRTIDRDVICFKKMKCNVRLDVQVSGSNQFIQLFRIEVNILDINDNAPSFTPSRLLLNISESRPQGTRIVLPTSAEDLDSGDNGKLTYDYHGNSSESIKLIVQNSGMDNSDLYLFVMEKLDREKNSVYMMEVVATDGGTPPKSGLLEIIICVEDANDNVPQFERDVYNVSIREDFPLDSPFVRVRAVDPDEGVNGQVVYSLARPSMSAFGTVFHVNGTTGDIYLRQSLDYGRDQEYILSIAATDSGQSPLPAYARLAISVIDVNDNAPIIRVASHLQVPEAQPSDTLVGHVSVDDMDSGQNGQVQCAISLSEFRLERFYPKVYKILTNKIFDREEQEDYSLTIECRDDGELQLTATQQIIIRIADVNDNDPVFTQDAYSVNVKENNQRDIPIMRITAKDNDSGENAAVEYRLSNNSAGLLSLDASTGIITTAGVFDFEERTHYEFIATAADRGQPRRSATTTIVLNVVDFNDEAPVFLKQSYSFGTYENQVPGTEIGVVSATDRDTSPYDKFTFSIAQSKPAANAFQVDSNSGRIVSLRVLDREQYPVHHLVIAATNIAYPNPSSFVNVTVSVADRNDNAPMIEFPTADNYTLEMAADAAAGTFLTKIIARDADLGENARLEYAIAKGNEGDVFEVNQADGRLTLKRPLSPLRATTRYSLVLVVRDFGEPEKSASAVLDIFVNKSADLTKSGAGYSSRLFNVNVDTIFSLEVIIILSSVMAALMIILIVTIVYIRRRNRVVVDRNAATPLAKVVCRSPRPPKHLTRKSETSNNEYTYRAAESVDNKEEITSTLRLNSDAYKYDLPDDVERPATHYTFAVSFL